MMTTWVPWPEFEAWIYTTCKWASSPQCVWLCVCVLLAQGAHMQRPCEDIRYSCLSLCTMLLWDESLTEARTVLGLVPNDPPAPFPPSLDIEKTMLDFSYECWDPTSGRHACTSVLAHWAIFSASQRHGHSMCITVCLCDLIKAKECMSNFPIKLVFQFVFLSQEARLLWGCYSVYNSYY